MSASVSSIDKASKRVSGIFRGAWDELAHPSAKRSPTLDVFRTIAVLLVVNGHGTHAFTSIHGENLYAHLPFTQAGWTGVDLFFALSGFLIGGQLWKEWNATGKVSFKNFMLRRGLRIWPLYFFMYLVALVILPASIIASRGYGWSDLLFVTNYVYQSNGLVNGSWSLCAEEQFYILAPLLIICFVKLSPTAFRWVLGAALLFEPIIRWLEYHHLTGSFSGHDAATMQKLYFPLHTHSDGLIYGLLIANFVYLQPRIKNRALPYLSIFVGLILLFFAFGRHVGPLDFSGLALTFGGLIWLSTYREFPFCNNIVFYWISRLSFGMYLNHESLEYWVAGPVVRALGVLRLGAVPAAFVSFLLLAACSAGVAAITFFLIEHPFLVLRSTVLRTKERVPLVAH